MKRILPIVVIGILVLSGLGAVAIPEEHTTPEPLLQLEPEIEITVKGGFLGYTIAVTNIGDVPINETMSITITTNATFMIIGDELSHDSFEIDLDVDESFKTNWGPVLGFGPATINVEGVFDPGGWGFSAEANGFVLLVYVSAKFDPIILPDT